MANGEEWRKYFEKKSTAYLKRQIKTIEDAYNKLDGKIIREFQLSHMLPIKTIIRIILTKRTQNKLK